MKEKAIYYYRNGYNCSACILKAAEEVYNIPITKQSLEMCSGISNGFGTGGMCSVLVAGIMVLGLIFDEAAVRRMRLEFLTGFSEKYGSINCSKLKNGQAGIFCEDLIGDAAKMLGEIIERNR